MAPAPGRRFLLFDADDTLWESNIYFEQAIEAFIDFLAHSSMSRDQVRAALDEVERINVSVHGYGSASFTRNLRETYERLAERDVQPQNIEHVLLLGQRIASQPVQVLPDVAETLREHEHRKPPAHAEIPQRQSNHRHPPERVAHDRQRRPMRMARIVLCRHAGSVARRLPVLGAALVYPRLPERPFAGLDVGFWLLSAPAQDLVFSGFLYGRFERLYPNYVHPRLPVRGCSSTTWAPLAFTDSSTAAQLSTR